MKYYYYSRISTMGQNAARQVANFKTHGFVNTDNVFIDKVQGDVPFFQREEAVKLFDCITENRTEPITVVIDSIDRLGRNLLDILKTIDIFNQNKINIKSFKEGLEILIDEKENPMAKIVCSVMGSIAEMERNRIKERQKEGIACAKAEGKYKGRKIGSKQSNNRLIERHPIIVKKIRKGLAIREIAEITKSSTTTIMKVKKVLDLK